MSERKGPVATFFHAMTRNGVSMVGAALTTASFFLFCALFAIESLGFEGGPYLGIVNFVVIPSVFVLGLVLIPVGLVVQRRRARRAASRGDAPPRLPILDLNSDRTRAMVVVFAGATMLNVVILAVATYKGVEVMETTKFCGASCHSVMNPEYTAYQRSPHASVPCVSCHVGPGAGWFVRSKMRGSWQLISVNLKLYPKPIPVPVHDLRAANDTCGHCHSRRYVDDRLKVITHYQDDEQNSSTKTVLSLKVGGPGGRGSSGIHWHNDPGVRIRYQSDEKREAIGTVELTRPDGTVTTFASKAIAATNAGAWRTMDCTDCHNRPGHAFRMPQAEVDHALADGALDKSIPFLRREGLKAIQAEYASQDEARQKIAGALETFYGASQPAVDRAKIAAAARELGAIYASNVFPSMNIKWGTYPTHLGHTDSPGCFRCHDGEHADAAGKTIPQDCDLCHAVLASDEPDPEILKTLQP